QKTQKIVLLSIPVEIFGSSSEESPESSSILVKKTPSSFTKKENPDSPLSFDLEDMQTFWSVSEKRKFLAIKNRPFAHGRVICLAQLEVSHCSVSHLFSRPKHGLESRHGSKNPERLQVDP
ncbi:hypothetical protein HAX54_000448, partial [Datura stramonium]|nr:hypothetical protein [Datura stramonium]